MKGAVSPGVPKPVADIVAAAAQRQKEAEEMVRGVLQAAFKRSEGHGLPRSREYMAGAEALLLCRAFGRALKSPYDFGTVQMDAWLAGVDEGKGWWRSQLAQHFPGR